MIRQEAKLKFWPRVLFFGIQPLLIGLFFIAENIVEIQWLFLFIVLSLLLYSKLSTSIELHEDRLKLKGLLFSGSLREMPLDKIQFIDAVSIVGTYIFRIGFDSSIIRSPFWHGTDNLFFLSPVFFDNAEAILRDIINSHPQIKVGKIAQDILGGKKKIPKYILGLLFGGLLLTYIIGIILMLRGRWY